MDLTDHYHNPYLRLLPHYRTYFPAIFRSCNPFVRSLTLSPRRTAFLLTLVLRTVQTSWYLFLGIMGHAKSNGIWLLVAICVVAFTVEMWNLHLVVEAESEGQLGAWRVPAGAFTLFVGWIAVWHVWMVPLEVDGMAFYGSGTAVLYVEGFWIAVIAFVAWVANREPVVEGLSLA
ncbi:uncharacterized protein M421DRAFT_424399 [Didymella exigua CBS 183.55]|uniref:Uncharacterized protein n=1 Tax=Didymella exigua CBS 183.55 TaxID=1150837 RepID=A0A6A5R948_9PLEO|nr:uncharacterized protein M421DRAFT_424399 [Didymella exigua CBS 183.55]KAF1924755.1 hypothetical protein M421DRAFT_424399 [Didymella exigua CBS 183.55]